LPFFTAGIMASRLLEVMGPMSASTWSLWISCVVRSTAVFGSVLSSWYSTSTLLPRMPPAALISATARSMPILAWLPNSSSPPENGNTAPMRMGPFCAHSGKDKEEAAAAARPARRTWRRGIMAVDS